MLNLLFLFRYKLHLLVQDLTGESNLMLLDSVAKTIVNASATKLLNGSNDKVIYLYPTNFIYDFYWFYEVPS